MKINRIFLALTALTVLTFSCADEDRAPIVDLTSVETGAYPRLISETDKLLNLFDVSGSNYTYQVEFVDIEGGTLVAEYVVDLYYDDNDPSNGDNSTGPIEYVKITADQFTAGANGYLQAPEINVNGAEVIAAAGLSLDDISAGDEFDFVGRVVLTDGRIFTQSNSSTTVYGAAFRGHFNFTMPASCPSDLTGTYEYTTTDVWCNGATTTGTVDIIAKGGGTYYWSDPSFGAYGVCYGGPANDPGLTFQDVCLEVAYTGVIDQYGDTWTYDSSVDGNNWIINWVNTYGEAANTTVVFPNGVPFTLE
jgi:hypothetical protein